MKYLKFQNSLASLWLSAKPLKSPRNARELRGYNFNGRDLVSGNRDLWRLSKSVKSVLTGIRTARHKGKKIGFVGSSMERRGRTAIELHVIDNCAQNLKKKKMTSYRRSAQIRAYLENDGKRGEITSLSTVGKWSSERNHACETLINPWTSYWRAVRQNFAHGRRKLLRLISDDARWTKYKIIDKANANWKVKNN